MKSSKIIKKELSRTKLSNTPHDAVYSNLYKNKRYFSEATTDEIQAVLEWMQKNSKTWNNKI
jgi:hypothetical protein